ncbi:MAG TPA: Ig-like domain repeat protein [Usitatibacter sp.]|nr:Ig-like domain repeat protein [Usitatibacter sp.]
MTFNGRLVGALLLLAGLATSAADAATPDISSRRTHTLALGADGAVYAWGSDVDGQLGIGRTLFATTPTVISGMPPIAAVEAGTNHIVALDDAGNIWSWGGNVYSQLGQRAEPNDSRPSLVLGMSNAIAVAVGQAFTAALKADGTVWFWGSLGGSGYSPIPRQVAGLQGIVRIDGGDAHLLALKSDGTVWAVGYNGNGQLGDGTLDSRENAAMVPGVSGVVAVAAGYRQSLALKSDGTVLAWGANFPQSSSTVSPVPVPGLAGVVAIAADQYSFAVKSDGSVVEWGNDFVVVPISGLTGVQRLAVGGGAGGYSLFGITAGGGLIADGSNAVGQRGLGDTDFRFTPTIVPALSGITHVAAGFYFAVARRSDGAVLVWGSNAQGQLGNGDIISHSIPRRVQGLPGNIVAIKAGSEFSLALDSGGEVWGWGRSDVGQLGSAGTPRSLPAKIPGLANVVEMSAGCNHSMFRLADGTVEIRGGVGQTNNGLVAGLDNIVRIGGGCGTAFAVRNDGVLFGWGSNSRGTVGDGTTIERPTPVPVTAIELPVVSIDLQQDHAIAVTNDGGVWTWGNNAFGQLGDGTDVARATPARVGGITNAVSAAAGFLHSLVLLADGTIRAWGTNFDGSVGDGTGIERPLPVALSTIDGVTRIAAGSTTSFAVRAGGTVWGWGSDRISSLPKATVGDGTYVSRLKPVLVLRDEESNGNLDSGNWYLDLDSSAPDNVPASALQRIIAVARLSGGDDSTSLSASINYRLADYGKTAGTYIMGHVPPQFLQEVQAAPGLSRREISKLVKNGTPILVQLTPVGWTTVSGQLVAFTSSTIAGNSAANNILNSVNIKQIPGARFCIGYGESAADMLSSQTLREVLTLQGAAGNADGLPCVLSGVYVSGPPGSNAGTAVTFTATVVGASPTGTVQLRDLVPSPAVPVGGALALVLQNEAVAQASYTTSALSTGAHSIAASYGGDNQNPASDSSFPLLHRVASTTTGSTVQLEGPVSSSRFQPVTFIARVTGNSPGGTVQFRDGGFALGSPVPLLAGTASTTIDSLAVGPHTITADYSGDGSNSSSTSNSLGHAVHGSLSSSVSLAVDLNPAPSGSSIMLTASVTGTNPTGQVTFRAAGITLGMAAVANGAAILQVAAPEPGVHAIVADYAGDASNPAASSSTLYLQVTQSIAPPSVTLSVTKPGAGSGSVTSVPSGIDCGSTCSASFASGTAVTLTATPAAGFIFIGWGGACSGMGQCNVTMSSARSVAATFGFKLATNTVLASDRNPAVAGQTVVFTANVTGGAPTGTVNFTNGNSLLCSGQIAGGAVSCQAAGLAVGTHSILAQYLGDASHEPSTSSPLNQLVQPARFTLTVTKTGNGAGQIDSSPPGISCGLICAADFDGGTLVMLTATPSASSVFTGWSGGCAGTGSCSITMAQATAVAATFVQATPGPSGSPSPASVAFGGQSIQTTSAPLTVVLTNVGTGTLAVSSVSVTAGAFSQVNDCAALATGASCTASVRFTPATEGPVSGSLTFTTSAGIVTVPLDGSGERSLVTHYYRAILGRAPDADGKAFWESEAARLQALGVNINEVWFVMAGYFFNSAEYLAANKTDAQFVGDLYNTFFNRAADAGGLGFWVGKIQSGLPREVVLFSFMFSPEFRGFTEGIFGNTAARPEVDMVVDFFRGLLNRLPDTPSFNFWLGEIRAAQCQGAGQVYTKVDQISAAFMFNPEYDGRRRSNTQFVTDMYYSFLRRGGDVDGVQFWINELDTGARFRNDVRYFGFLNSAEFGARVQAVIAAGCVQ